MRPMLCVALLAVALTSTVAQHAEHRPRRQQPASGVKKVPAAAVAAASAVSKAAKAGNLAASVIRSGQDEKKAVVRKGGDGRPLLFGPNMELCQKRKSHGKLGTHHYFLSWREPWNKFEDWDWFNGRNFCRERCMDLVSFETALEFQMFKEVMAQDNITSIWTSGRKCNFKGKGCENAKFDPINVNGWFWAGAGNVPMPPTDKPNKDTFWSKGGPGGKPQPDNFEGVKAGKLAKVSDPVGLTVEGLQEWHDEACMAVLNNKYGDGIAWHDLSCYQRAPVVCEDSDALLARAVRENPGHTIPEPVTPKN